MPINFQAGLDSAFGRLRRPVEDLVQKVKRQNFRIPQVRMTPQQAKKPFESLAARIPEPKVSEPVKGLIPPLAAPGIAKGIIRNAPSIFIDEKDEGFLSPKFLKKSELITRKGFGGLNKEDQRSFLEALEAPVFGATTTPVKGRIKPIDRLIDLVQEAKPVRAQQEALYTAERSIRSEKIAEIGDKMAGEAGFLSQLKSLKGELPKVQFSRIRQNFSQEEVDSLFNSVDADEFLLPFQKITVKNAVAKLLDKRGGQVPTNSEIKLLGQVFPEELVKAIQSKDPASKKLLRGLGEVFNVPRSLMATMDLSAPFRQGAFLVGRPKQWAPAFKSMFKYAVKEEAYDDLFKQIRKMDTYPQMVDSKLSLTDMRSPSLADREEMFMSNLAQKIPGVGKLVRGSDRAYTGFLNKLRADTFDDMLKGSMAAGLPQTPKLQGDIAKFVNAATGRGSLGGLEKAASALNTAFFSPRLIASRVNLLNPKFYAGLEPHVRKQALKSLVTFGGLGMSVLGMAKLAGADVGADPRSADFGKIKIGNTRFDIWGGFQQYFKLAGQLISGEVVSSQTGRVITLGEGYKPLTRKDILLRFFEGKLAPIPSFAKDLLKGQSALGGPLDVPKEVADRLTPIVVGDLYEMYQEGELGLLGWLPNVFGVGTQTYGKQELVAGTNVFGEPLVEVKPTATLGEKVSEKILGPQPLRPSTATSIQTFYDQLLEMPREEAAATFDEIIEKNPDLAKKILDVAKEKQEGITIQNKTLKAKGVSSGDRATAVLKEFNRLDTNEEKAALWEEYVKKKIITKEVAEQLQKLMQQEEEDEGGLRIKLPKLVPEVGAAGEDDPDAVSVSGPNLFEWLGGKVKDFLKDILPKKSETIEVGGEAEPKPQELKVEKEEEPPKQVPVQDLRVFDEEPEGTPKPVKDLGRNPTFETVKPTSDVSKAIESASDKYDVPAALLYDIALQESTLDSGVVNETEEGKAAGNPTGLFQFTDGTWEMVKRFHHDPDSSLKLPNLDRKDPETNATAAAFLIKNGQLGRWDASENIWGEFWPVEELEGLGFYDQTLVHKQGVRPSVRLSIQ